MATILFSAIGTLVGGPLGGAIGALVGRGVDTAIIGSSRREGPRLKELTATTSSYGAALPRHYGRMRVPGTIIWATDLVEHRDRQGGGKGRPSVTTYSYTASFAVALSSRPILGVGRVWADGNLLRGAAGDLKTGGAMRIHTGGFDQPCDPLIAQVEGAARCPAWRGLAYVVFEDLDLGDFFNRIPALSFEVIADESGVSLGAMVGDAVSDTQAILPLPGIAGFSCEGPVADTLSLLDPLFPMDCDGAGDTLAIAPEQAQAEPVALPPPAAAPDGDSFGEVSGFTRRRAEAEAHPPEILRYYDIDRDYQPGLQRAPGRTPGGQPRVIELPAAIAAADARALAVRATRRSGWARETLAWRMCEIDPRVRPGAIVTTPLTGGRWRVTEWEWRADGVELSLSRVVPNGADALPSGPVDPGRNNAPVDAPAPPSLLVAFELPWDGAGSGDTPAPFAAVSSPGATWSGAALFVDDGSGELRPLGPSGRTRSVVGTAETALPPAGPLLIDRASSVTVVLADPAMDLADATGRQLASGANRALLGGEIIQFGKATPLGGARWRLETLLRGRGGTESAITAHDVGDAFVLLDARPVALDPGQVGAIPGAEIVAFGRGDAEPVASPIVLRGITRRPLAPVHARATAEGDGSLRLRWTRRARGAWLWTDGVEAPLHEQAERYRVTYGPALAPAASWDVDEPEIVLPAATLASLASALPGGAFHVRQQGTYALSEPLFLATPA